MHTILLHLSYAHTHWHLLCDVDTRKKPRMIFHCTETNQSSCLLLLQASEKVSSLQYVKSQETNDKALIVRLKLLSHVFWFHAASRSFLMLLAGPQPM